jgi:hypothetical protein
MKFPSDLRQIPHQPIYDGHSNELRLLSTSSHSKVSSTVHAQFIRAITCLVLQGTHNTSDMHTAIYFSHHRRGLQTGFGNIKNVQHCATCITASIHVHV